MSNNAFLAVVSTIIVLIVGVMAVQKYEACMELGGKACPGRLSLYRTAR